MNGKKFGEGPIWQIGKNWQKKWEGEQRKWSDEKLRLEGKRDTKDGHANCEGSCAMKNNNDIEWKSMKWRIDKVTKERFIEASTEACEVVFTIIIIL